MITAQPGPEISNVEAYRARILGFLGQRDPLQVLAETASILEEIVCKYPAKVLQARPFAEKWTPNEIIGHLTDSEWVNGYRLRLVLCEDNPTILGMNQDLWVSRQGHNDQQPSELVKMFRAMRQFNLPIWKRMSSGDLKRTGQHNERGAESLGVMLRMLAGHDLAHLDQLNRYIDAARTAA